MPACMSYPPFGSDAWKVLDQKHTEELMKRRDLISQSWKWYDGDFKNSLAPDGTQTDDNVKVPLVEMVINQAVSSMQGVDDHGIIEGIKFEVSQPQAPVQAEDNPDNDVMRFQAVQPTAPQNKVIPAEQEYLDRVFELNKKNLFTHKLFLNSAVTGHAFVRLVPEAIKDTKDNTVKPRMIALNSSNVSVFWRADDMELVVFWRVEHGDPGNRTRQDIYQTVDDSSGMAVGMGDWRILSYTENGKTNEWSKAIEVSWSYPFPPIVDWQNLPNTREYYGKNDIGLIGSLNESYNFTAGNYQRILKYQAYRADILIGATVKDVQATGVGYLLTVANPDAKVISLQGAPAMDSSLAFMESIRRSSFDSGRELDPSSVADRLGDLTNFALRVLNDQRLAKRHTKWLNAEEGFETLCQYLLVMGGYAAETEINIIPPDPLPQDPLQQAQTLVLDVEKFGISKRTAQEKRGYDPEQEKTRNDEESQTRIAEQVTINTSQAFGGVAAQGRLGRREMNGQPESGTIPAGNIAGRPAAIV